MPPRRLIYIRTIVGALLSLFVFVNIAAIGVLGAPRRVQATGLPVVDILANSISTGEVIGDQIFQAIWDGLVGAVLTGATFFAQRLAYDTATSLANAGTGKEPLFQNKSFGTYLEDVGKDAMGETLNKLAKDWVGLDLCQPIDIRARLAIQIGLRQAFERPLAKCSWDKIGENWEKQWETLKEQYGGCSGGATGVAGAAARGGRTASGSVEDCMLAVARDVFKPSNTELGISVEANVKIQDVVRRKELASTREREEGGGFKPVKDIITGNVKTPAKAVEEESKEVSSPKQKDRSFQLISGTMASGAKGALVGTLSIFANTFLSQLGNRVMSGLFETKPGGGGGVALSPLAIPGGGSEVGVSSQVTALLTQTVSVRDAGLYDILSQFVVCPSESGDINRRPDECVIDTDFEAAVRSAESGDPLTIKQAMEKDLLKKNWRLVSPSDVGLNTNVDCRNQAYCHSNIAKLRQARIVPLGFEIAAALSPRDSQWTLGEVVAGFNDCNAQGDRAADKPFCHLIDPNWILKAPLTRCKAEVPGPMLATRNSNIRHDICVDKPTCLQDDGKGGCESPWGYCVREKNIWRLNGDSCPAQFSTCATYTGVSPGAQQKVTYLSRTVDFATCTEQDVGCREYRVAQSRRPNEQGEYAWQAGSRYFNGKTTACTQPGCTQFIQQDGASAYLKKAPLYLQCYDTNPQTETVIEWPEKLADLVKLKPRTECKDYAPVCVKDEVGCTRYAPENGDPPIPAIAGNGDKCAQECVGYSTYKQMPSAFERAKFPLYFIPETANQCSGAEVGCDQFVNVERGESAEYYSFVRQCEKPASNNTNSVVFYAWEGSDAQGYQLRSYVLKRGPRMYQEDPTDVTPAYAAAYDAARMTSYLGICNKDTDRLADPDCRELFDRDGNAYYRLLSKTITVSDECTAMRKTDADIYYASREVIANQASCTDAKGAWSQNQGCQICEGGGALQNGVCLYAMMKSEATSCRAEASGCRAYTGNAGNNVRIAYQAKFDDLDTTGWSDGTLSAESVVVGGKSLRVDDRNVSLSISSTPAAGSQYHMNFWAKGQGTLTVTFDRAEAEPSNRATFRLTGDWHQFSLGPVYVKSVEAGAAIVFVVDQNVPLFMDNIVIRETIDTVNVVKDSWKTPLTCDANPNDKDGAGNPIPGEALGCQLYRDHNDAPVSLKSFTRICRDEAVGCEKLTDTKNTPELEGKTYQMRCGRTFMGIDLRERPTTDRIDPDSRACTPDFDVDGDGQKDNTPVCTLPLGKDYCTFTVNRTPAPDDLDYHWGGVRVPADDIAYLVNRQEFRCDTKEKGCMALGEVKGEVSDQTITSVNKLVDAEKYDQLLCTAEVEGCEAYSSSVGGAARTTYFRDPSVTGRPLCEYKENVDSNSGWFLRGTSNPCYAGYRVTGNLYGVKSQGDPGYSGNVGLCPEQNNACKEFRDPADTSQLYPEGQPYYVLDNAKIDKSSCNGQASLQEGCVLFNDTSVPAKPWNSVKTYGLSSAKNGGLVAPASVIMNAAGGVACISEGCYRPEPQDANAKCRDGYRLETMVYRDAQGNITRTTYNCVVPKNDANTILKVTRDRACAEWLACRSAAVTVDKTTNQKKIVCNDVALCDNFASQPGQNEQCANYVTEPEWAKKVLSADMYSARDVDWYGSEYSGYSFYNKFQITDYRFLRSQNGVVLAAVPYSFADAQSKCGGKTEGQRCDGRNGVCIGSVCTRPFDGGAPPEVNRLAGLENSGGIGGIACRGYAQDDAPFTFKADTQVRWKSVDNQRPEDNKTTYPEEMLINGFDQAQVCQVGEKCMCSYKKVDFGNGEFTRYYDEGTEEATGICRGGYTAVGADKTGRTCVTSKDCRDDRFVQGADGGITVDKSNSVDQSLTARDQREGECVTKSMKTISRGWLGYCLEKDKSILTPGSGIGSDGEGYACLTWMPLDAVPGAPSIENQVESAGYVVTQEKTARYCAESVGNAVVSNEGVTYSIANASVYHSHSASDKNNITRTQLNNPASARTKMSDIDYISVNFNNLDDVMNLLGVGGNDLIRNSLSGNHLVTAGSVNIYNDGKYHIYSANPTSCQWTAWFANITDMQTPPPDGESDPDGGRFVCHIDAGLWGSVNIMTQARTAGGKQYFVVAISDGGDDNGCGDGDDCEMECRGYHPVTEINVKLFCSFRGRTTRDWLSPDYAWNPGGGEGDQGDSGDGAWIVYREGNNGNLDANFFFVTIDLAGNTTRSEPWLMFNTSVVKREMCREVVEIADEGHNAAWTDRLRQPKEWWESNYTIGLGPGPSEQERIRQVVFGTSATPFGGVANNAGVRFNSGPLIQRSTVLPPQDVKGGEMFACGGGMCGVNEVNNAPWPDVGIRAGKLLLSKLFGKAYKSYTLEDDRTGYTTNQCPSRNQGSGCYDVRGEVENALPPRIASLDMDKCDVDASVCAIKEGGRFTLNDVDGGIVFGNGSKSVTTRFFAWADKDRMPIKDVIVDWGVEGGVSASSPGKYKNRKPECNDTTFGDSTGACEKAHFEFFGSYAFAPGTSSCRYTIGGASPDDFTDANRAQLTRFGLKPNDRYCAFKPKVIIIDNWGWCNGTCQQNIVPDGDHAVTHRGCWGSEDSNSPNYQRCTNSNLDDNPEYSKAGTPFNGWVIVAEQK